MAGDIFGYSRKTAKPVAAFDPINSILTVEGTNPEGFLIQQWNIQYNQDVSEIFELGSDAVYWVKGRPTGQGTIQRIMGVRGNATSLFPDNAFDICKGGVAMSFMAGSGPCESEGAGKNAADARINLDGVLITHIGFSMQAPSGQGGAQALLNEDISFRFSFMEVN